MRDLNGFALADAALVDRNAVSDRWAGAHVARADRHRNAPWLSPARRRRRARQCDAACERTTDDIRQNETRLSLERSGGGRERYRRTRPRRIAICVAD